MMVALVSLGMPDVRGRHLIGRGRRRISIDAIDWASIKIGIVRALKPNGEGRCECYECQRTTGGKSQNDVLMEVTPSEELAVTGGVMPYRTPHPSLVDFISTCRVKRICRAAMGHYAIRRTHLVLKGKKKTGADRSRRPSWRLRRYMQWPLAVMSLQHL